MCSSVDLPAPDGPVTTTNSPACRTKSTSTSTFVSSSPLLYALSTSASCSTGFTVGLPRRVVTGRSSPAWTAAGAVPIYCTCRSAERAAPAARQLPGDAGAVGHRLRGRPGHVICLIMTEGMENASWDAVQLLTKQQKEEWNRTFIFLGANIDA